MISDVQFGLKQIFSFWEDFEYFFLVDHAMQVAPF